MLFYSHDIHRRCVHNLVHYIFIYYLVNKIFVINQKGQISPKQNRKTTKLTKIDIRRMSEITLNDSMQKQTPLKFLT